MDKIGQTEDIGRIFAAIISFFILIVFISAIIPIFGSLSGGNDKQAEINNLNLKVNELNQVISSKDVELSQLKSIIDSTNKNLTEKDSIISNLTSQIIEKQLVIENLTLELTSLKEKKYLQEINNQYYNISNYFERIENKFFPIEVSISVISAALLSVLIKEFALISWFKRLWGRFKNGEERQTNSHG
jgi:hypothetical protein